jgi:hypothetical protein
MYTWNINSNIQPTPTDRLTRITTNVTQSIPNTRVHFAQALMGLTNAHADVQGLIQQALQPSDVTSLQSFFKEANIAQ